MVGVLAPVAFADPPPLQLAFVDNHNASARQLRAAIAAVRAGRDVDAHDADALAYDSLVVSGYYLDHGYADVHVEMPTYDAATGTATFVIVEGASYNMGSVTVDGELIGDAAANMAMIRIRKDMVFSRVLIAGDLETLSTFYQDRGYARVNVEPITKVDKEHRTIDLRFEITRGKPARFGRVAISGNARTPDATIRHALALAPGQSYSETALVTSKRQVLALGFDDVVISTKRGTSDELVDVTFEIVESGAARP
jgi:outer membrane protein insertion porin family